MYVNMSPRAQFFANLGRLGGLVARGVAGVAQNRRAQRDETAALDEVAEGKPCTPCEAEQARLRAEAEAWMSGR